MRPLELSTEGAPYLLDPVVRLSPLTVIIGANASGKSTLLKTVKRCLMDQDTDDNLSGAPALFAWPESVDESVLVLALVSVDGIDELEEVIGCMWTDNDGRSEEWDKELEDVRHLSKEQWIEQLPRLFRAKVSYSLFLEFYHRRNSINVEALVALCKSLEPELRVGFQGAKVGVALSSDALRRLRPTFIKGVESGLIGAGNTTLESFIIRVLANDFEPSPFVWIRRPDDAFEKFDYEGDWNCSPPLYLAYERDRGRGIDEQVEGAAKQYLERTIESFESSVKTFHSLYDAGSPLAEDESTATFSTIDAGVASPPEETTVTQAVEHTEENVSVTISNEVKFKLLSSVPTSSMSPVKITNLLTSALDHLRFGDWMNEGKLRWWRPWRDEGLYELNPFVQFVIERAEYIANTFGPSFVQREGRIRISASQRTPEGAGGIRINFEVEGKSIPLEECSDGIAKYIVLSVQLGLHMISGSTKHRGSISIRSETTRTVESLYELYEEVISRPDIDDDQLLELAALRNASLSRVANIPGIPNYVGRPDLHDVVQNREEPPAERLSFELPFNAQGVQTPEWLDITFTEFPCRPVLLLDEPENHLHPSACRSVSGWLENLESWFLLVVVATHNAELMDIATPDAEVLVAEKSSEGSRLSRRHHDVLRQNKVLMEQMGLTAADLLLRSSYVLFVEGAHDKIILETWFSSRLRRAGVYVFPMHGLNNAGRIPDSEFVWNIGIKVGILVDDLDQSVVRNESNVVLDKQSTEYKMKVILDRWRGAGRDPDVFGLSKKDILFYIDPDAVREHSRDFSNWESAYEEAAKAGQTGSKQWKAFVQRRYGVGVSDDPEESVREMCRTAQEMELIPREMREKIEEVIRAARP